MRHDLRTLALVIGMALSWGSAQAQDGAAPNGSTYTDRTGRPGESIRGARYCQILLGYVGFGGLRAEVWGTQGLNLCPAESWEALDPSSIRAEYRALFIELIGPRATVVDAASIGLVDAERRTFGDLEMHRLATLTVNPAQARAAPYTEASFEQHNAVFHFWSGHEVYQLTAPDGTVYVMLSMSQIVDPSLTLADLPELGSRLALPDGWSFGVDRPITDLVLAVDGETYVVQDELKNTYARLSARTP